MSIEPELYTGTEAPIPQIVREHLLAIEWGVDSYPQELLELNEDETRILKAVNGGKSMTIVAEEEGTHYDNVSSAYRSALGKQEAFEGLGGDILALSPQAQRLVVLNALLGGTWNRGRNNLMTQLPETMLVKAKALDELLGDNWKRCPKLLLLGSETVRDRIQRYDESLGPRWRQVPTILTLGPTRVEERAAIYDEWFGDQWYVCPALLTNVPETVASSARALKTLGIIPGTMPTKPYFNLLGTNVASKRRKAEFIHKAILGHTAVRISEAKRSKSEIVRERLGQSPSDRQKELEEIEELKAFIRHIGARGLVRSLESIWTWAKEHDYVPSHAVFVEPPIVRNESVRLKHRQADIVEAEPDRVEVRDGQEFRVFVIPEKKRRAKKSRR